MSKGKFAIGALIGAVAGFVAGIVTAPKSGKETIADIKVVSKDIKNEVIKKVGEVSKEANVVVEEVKDKAEDVAKDVTEKAINLKERTNNAIDGAKKGFFSEKK